MDISEHIAIAIFLFAQEALLSSSCCGPHIVTIQLFYVIHNDPFWWHTYSSLRSKDCKTIYNQSKQIS